MSVRRGFLPFLAFALPLACAAAQQAPPPQTETQAPPPVAPAPGPQALSFDPAHTRLGFKLRARWGQLLQGWFPHYEASIGVLPDGRHQVQLKLYTADVDVNESARYSAWARGDSFFDTRHYPTVTWASEPYDVAVVAHGGRLPGTLTIRNVSRPEKLEVAPPPVGCAHPGYDCDVQITGAISRDDYGMDGYRMALDDRVEFVLRMRLMPPSVASVAP